MSEKDRFDFVIDGESYSIKRRQNESQSSFSERVKLKKEQIHSMYFFRQLAAKHGSKKYDLSGELRV